MLVIKIKVCMFGQVIHLIGKTDQKVLLRFFFFFKCFNNKTIQD